MKILIVADNYYPNVNGSSYFTQRLAYYLKKRGHEVLVMCAGPSIKHKSFRHNEVDVFGIRSYPLSFIYNDFRFSLPIGISSAIETEMKRFRPDVIHIQDHFVIAPVVQKVAKKLGIPIMGTNHFMPENILHYLHLPKGPQNLIRRWMWRQFRQVFEDLGAVTTPTATAAGLLKEVNLTKPVLVVSNGIDLKRFKPTNQGQYLKDRYHLPDKPTLLYVGRLDKEKNLDVILKALPQALAEVEFHFVIAGKGAEQIKLRNLAEELGLTKSVTFTGFVSDDDLPNLYTAADCFIIAGIAELQSLVTMEAMASGLPVIAVNAMALPELVKHNENGYLFELTEIENLAKLLINIFSSPSRRKEMSDASLQRIRAHDIDKSMAKFESLYQELIATNATHH